jgi:HD-GYP domain-containing protein (c-di-GMP phosphodiesterase class II)
MAPASQTRRGRLLWTLIAVLTLVSVLPLLISHFVLIGINRDSLETLEKKYLTRSAVGISSDIQNLVSSYQQQLLKIAGGIQTNSALLPPDADPFVHPMQNAVLAGYTSSDPDLLALRILNRDGQGAAAQPAGLGSDVTRDLNFGAGVALGGQPYVGSFQYISVLNQPAIVIAVPVSDGNQTIGAVEGLVSLRRITDRLKEESKADVTAFVVDRTGKVLMHSEPFMNVQRPSFAQLKIVQEFMKAPVRLTESYEDLVNGHSRKMLGTVSPVGGPDWGVVVQKEQSRAFASVQKMIRRTVEWSAIAFAFSVLVGVLFAAGVTRPIRALAEKTQEIAQGNYDQRVETRSRNEIGVLADNFNVMSAEIQKAVEGLKRAAHENHLLFLNSIRMLAAAIDAKDPYTRGHSERVARYSVAIGKHMRLSAEEMKNLRISALLHDVGKIGIDDRILRKPGALSEDEFEVMKGHPEKGAAIMGGVLQLNECIPGMKYHHEKWSGGGYPDGLKGDEIPMQARIVSIADTFDAMTTNRPYQKAMDLNYVVEKIMSFAGSRFDPRVCDAFVQAVKQGDIQVEEPVRAA